ncbi:signal peptidase I [Dermatophilaceae bacterium Soc4.6]
MTALTTTASGQGHRVTWAWGARATARWTGNTVAVLATLALLALGIGPHVLDYRTMVMRTGSMEPAISPGDVLVVRPEPVASLSAGQILTFAAPVAGSPVFSHRVVAVQRTGSDTLVTTKGDANAGADPWQARISDQRVWHAVYVVPGVGWAIAGLQHPIVRVVSGWMIPGVLCLEVLLRLWRRPRHQPGPVVSDEVAS